MAVTATVRPSRITVRRFDSRRRDVAEAWTRLCKATVGLASAFAEFEKARRAYEEAQRGTGRVDHREGVYEVYDHEGRYVGCIGSEAWDKLMDEPQRG
jgi:hypothetical protein